MKKDMMIGLAAIVVVAAICFGLAVLKPGSNPLAAKSADATSTAATSSDASASSGSDKVVMHVNGEPVTEREFNMAMASAPEQMQSYYASPEGKAKLAEEIAKIKVLEQEGKKMGLDKDPEVESRVNFTRSNLMAAAALKKLMPAPSDADLKSEYTKNQAQMQTIDLSHIVVAVQGGQLPPKNGAPLTVAAGMEKAREIVKRLRAGADFQKMAAAVSDDQQTAARGGSLGPIPPSNLPPELQPVLKLAPGDISDPIQTAYGIHVFKMGKRDVQAFDKVKSALTQKVQQDQAAAMVEKYRKDAKVELDPKFFGPAPGHS